MCAVTAEFINPERLMNVVSLEKKLNIPFEKEENMRHHILEEADNGKEEIRTPETCLKEIADLWKKQAEVQEKFRNAKASNAARLLQNYWEQRI